MLDVVSMQNGIKKQMRMIAEEFGASIHAVEDKVNAMAAHIGADISRTTPFALRRRMNE